MPYWRLKPVSVLCLAFQSDIRFVKRFEILKVLYKFPVIIIMIAVLYVILCLLVDASKQKLNLNPHPHSLFFEYESAEHLLLLFLKLVSVCWQQCGGKVCVALQPTGEGHAD